MLQKLTAVAPRDNDALTLRRGQALAQVLLLLMTIEGALGCIALLNRDVPAIISTTLGLAISGLVFAVNRNGRVRLALSILLIGGTCTIVSGAIVAQQPTPTIFFLGLIVMVAALGSPRAPLIWAAALSCIPFILNLLLYGGLLAPAVPMPMPSGLSMPSISWQEQLALALLWMLAGTAYLSSRLLNQMLEESRAATEQGLAINQELRRSEERFSKVFQRNPVGISITRLDDGRVIDINDSLLSLLEYSRDEVIGKTTLELNIWAQNSHRERTVQMLRERQSIHDQELRIRTKSGELREGLNAIELIELDGEICMLSMLYDITDWKRAEAGQRQSEERFAKVFHFSPVAIVVATLDDGRVIDVNEHFVELTGYGHDDVIGGSAIALDVWSDPEKRASIIQALRKHQPIRDTEANCHARSGIIRKVLVSAELIELSGEPCALLMFYDTTERKQIEAALRDSEEQYRLIAEHSRDLIVLLDHEGRVLYASPSHQHVLGYAPIELIGQPAINNVHPDDRELIAGEWAKLANQDHIQVTVRARHANGDWLWMEISSSILHQQGSTLNVSRDITERKRLEAQLLQSQKMETVGRLAGGVAHDFNNLLTAITGYADLALEDLPPASPVRDDIKELRKAADRATNLTRQLLAFARKQMIEPRVTNLNQLISDMHGFIGRLIGEHIELNILPAPDLGSVRVDTNQIEQVVVNLVINARDAMPQGGRLMIETANAVLDAGYAGNHMDVVAGRYILLTIGDTGVGMDATVQEHLFEPFFTTKGPGKGTGLGLATCYGILKQHGGYILPYSEVGRGTLMKVYLPRVDAPLDPLPIAEAQPNSHGSESILLVEDEPAVRDLAARVLRGQGYAVLEAGDGIEALQLIAQHPDVCIDLLITDVVMPRMGGGALAERLIALRPGIKVLFTSGYTEDAMLHAGQLATGTHFMHKPFSPVALAQKVRGILDS